MEYTLEVYRKDRRCKAVEKLVDKVDLGDVTFDDADAVAMAKEQLGYRVVIKETYVTRTNLLSGTAYRERYDTPVYCSPASESYWSM